MTSLKHDNSAKVMLQALGAPKRTICSLAIRYDIGNGSCAQGAAQRVAQAFWPVLAP